MMEWLEILTFWHWWLAAIALALLDVLWPPARLRFAAIGAALAGFSLLLQPAWWWGWQWLLFVAATCLGIGYSYVYKALAKPKRP